MAQFSVSDVNYETGGYVLISWTNAGIRAGHFSYRVYRRNADTGGSWTLIYETNAVQSNYSFQDYLAPVGNWQYSVVEVYTSGSLVEETYVIQTVSLELSYYWLIHPSDNSKNIILRGVTGETFSTEREVSIKKLIGRGRKVDVGSRWGYTGEISGRLYPTTSKSARQQRLDLETAKATNVSYTLRNPFGDVFKIWFDDPKFTRVAGTGGSEVLEVSFTYYEVV